MRSVQAFPRIISVERLNDDTFQRYGRVIENPEHSSKPQPAVEIVNQGTASKYADISVLENLYHKSSNSLSARASMSLFVCSPRHSAVDLENSSNELVSLSILERHQFTTQTFMPLGLRTDQPDGAYLVVVAPSKSDLGSKHDLPDVENMQAFVAHGSQAITYGAGVWHAPMIVIAGVPLTFVVIQFVNGNPQDDCEECEIISSGFGVRVRVKCSDKLRASL